MSELRALLPELRWAEQAAIEALHWFATLPYPAFERDYTFVALRHPDEYPFNEGRIVSNRGLDIAMEEFPEHFTEVHVAHSNALQAVLHGDQDYHCGPLARFNLNYELLPAHLRQEAARVGLQPPCSNPFKSLMVRMMEVAYAFHEAVRVIEAYRVPSQAHVEIVPRHGTGHACTEAPRGMLYHRYTVDDEGLIQKATIVPPTSQNQKCIERDLWTLAPSLVKETHERATWLAEQAVRNYDPCISCATHFLRLEMVEDPA